MGSMLAVDILTHPEILLISENKESPLRKEREWERILI